MQLTDMSVGTRARVTAVDLPDQHRQRLAVLGVFTGSLVEVAQRAGFGGRVVRIGSGRLALDGSTCASIAVDAA